MDCWISFRRWIWEGFIGFTVGFGLCVMFLKRDGLVFRFLVIGKVEVKRVRWDQREQGLEFNFGRDGKFYEPGGIESTGGSTKGK